MLITETEIINRSKMNLPMQNWREEGGRKEQTSKLRQGDREEN